MCSPALEQKVRDAVHEKMVLSEPFTTADISHPLIKEDPDIRHRHVKDAIGIMENNGEMQIANFTVSMITVYPNGPGTTGTQARLWHPIGFNPDDYTGNKKVLVRSTLPSIVSSQSGSGSQLPGPAIYQTPLPPASLFRGSKNVVTKTVSIQAVQKALNIPRKFVKLVGLNPGDPIEIFSISTGSSSPLIFGVRRSNNPGSKQKVDKEGRIRLYGSKARKATSRQSVVSVSVVNDNGSKFISIT